MPRKFCSRKSAGSSRRLMILTPGVPLPRIFFQSDDFPFPPRRKRTNGLVPTLQEEPLPIRGHDAMTADHRFMTYTQLEKAYRRRVARRMPGRQKLRTLQTRYRQIADAVDVNAWIEKGQSDILAPLRPMTVVGQAKGRPLHDHAHTLERIIADRKSTR